MTSLQRRNVLFGGAALAATASLLVVPSSAKAALNVDSKSPDRDAPVVVRWNSTTDRWAARPTGAPFGVVFLSTNDAHATAPTDPTNMVGDVWRRHPDAVAA